MRALLALFALLFLSACAELEFASHLAKRALPGDSTPPSAASQGNFKVGNPYKVDGRWYYPREEYNMTETGLASWYGPGFHGKRTANGEVFDKNELTAAHRTLQMPSLVRVTNLDNGKSLIVRVNDRGPFKRGRIMDVSERAAELLGFKNAGTAKVKLQVLKDESLRVAEIAKRGASTKGYEVAMNTGGGMAPSVPAAETSSYYGTAAYEAEPLVAPGDAPGRMATSLPGHLKDGEFYPDPVITEFPVTPSHIYVQAGSFGVYDNALRLRDRLSGYSNATVEAAQVNGREFFRVRLGPVANVEDADKLLSRILSDGFDDGIIVVE